MILKGFYGMKHYLVLLIVVLSAAMLSGCTLATVRSLQEDGEAKEGFNPDTYVVDIWESQFIPTMNEGAIDISTLLEGLAADEQGTIEQYGKRTSSGPFSFMTRGEGRILELDRSSRVGLAALDLSPFDGEADVYLAIGPVLRGNALRDAVGFIVFNDFTNQVEFASVSSALKDYIAANVLEPSNIDSLVGETVRFMGAFTFEELDEIVIMPVMLEKVQ